MAVKYSTISSWVLKINAFHTLSRRRKEINYFSSSSGGVELLITQVLYSEESAFRNVHKLLISVDFSTKEDKKPKT